MIDQLLPAAGVVVGIAATAGGTWWNERTKFKREKGKEAAAREREVNHRLLSAVDERLASWDIFEEEHGVLPADMGYDMHDTVPNALLTEVHLNSRPKVHAAALVLVETAGSYAWFGGKRADFNKARAAYIELIRERH